MTDSRLRGEWLNSMRFDDLSDVAWRVFTNALMWSNENGTDGHVPTRYLKMLHPDGVKTEAYAELAAAGIWTSQPVGYFLNDWKGALGQSAAIEVETYKANARGRQQKWRDRQRDKLARTVGFQDSDSDVTRYGTRDVTENVGKGEGEGLGKDNEAETSWFVDEASGEVIEPVPAWGSRLCVVCKAEIPADSPVPWCGLQDERHLTYMNAAHAA